MMMMVPHHPDNYLYGRSEKMLKIPGGSTLSCHKEFSFRKHRQMSTLELDRIGNWTTAIPF
jgi:hypothetical protein